MMTVPKSVPKLRSRDEMPSTMEQVDQKIVLLGLKLNTTSAYEYDSRHQIYVEQSVTHRWFRAIGCFSAPARHCTNASRKLTGSDGLDQEIVRYLAQRSNAVSQVRKACKHYDAN